MASHDIEVSGSEEAVEALAKPLTQSHATPYSATQTAVHTPPPRLATGLELIGEFEGSGFKQPPFIARRADGQMVQMHEMLYRLAEQIDGQADLEEVAGRFSHAIRRDVQAGDVETLIDRQLRPLGVAAGADGSDPVELTKVDPLLALKFRASLVSDGAVRRLTSVFRPLFAPVVMVLFVAGFLGLDGWLFFVHGITQSVRHTLYQPALMLLLIAGVVIATAFHEIGHATACRYGGAKPGVMGVGIYIVWPAFYTDITDAYRLGKWGRLRADVGGMYFNAIFALVMWGLYAVTGFEPLLLLVLLQNFAIVQQALPLLRLDGYYILSDLTGVPDIFLRIRAVLSSLIPGREAEPRVKELKDWVRIVVTLYVLFVVLFISLSLIGIVINLPRLVSTGYDSAALRVQAIGPAFDHGQPLRGVLDAIQLLFLLLPGAGLVLTAGRVGRRLVARARAFASGHTERQVALAGGAAALVALAIFSWWPHGQYRPLQPGERGTIPGLFGQIGAIPTGRASLTTGRARELGGAPFESRHAGGSGAGSGSGSGSGSRSGGKGSAGAGGSSATPVKAGSNAHHAAGVATTGTSTTTTPTTTSTTTTTGTTTTTPAATTATTTSTTPAGSSGTSTQPATGETTTSTTTPAPASQSTTPTDDATTPEGSTTTSDGAPTATMQETATTSATS